MVNVYDVGDAAPLHLLIDEADATTVATVVVRSPTGRESELAATPNEARDEWTTALRLTEPGVWLTTWTVEGTGAGTETHRLAVRPSAGGRSYASTADLAAWLGDGPPGNADALLTRATRLVDRVMVGAAWEALEGTDQLPADPAVAAAYRDATCAQVAAWLEDGAGDYGSPDEGSDDDEAAELAAWASAVGATSVSLDGVSIGLKGSSSSGSSSSSGPAWSTPSDEAVMVLRTAGLFPPRVQVV